MTASDETWAEVRRACCETAESVTAIALRFGVGRPKIYRRAASEGWQLPNRHKAPRKRATWRGRAAVKVKAKARETIVDRLRRLAMRNLDFLEDMMDGKIGPLTAAEQDRVTKAVVGTTRIVEKLNEAQPEHGKSDAAEPGRTFILSGVDVDRMRIEIAERLERIHRRRNAAGGSE